MEILCTSITAAILIMVVKNTADIAVIKNTLKKKRGRRKK